MEKINCAVLGATGVVGQHFLKLLVDHPYFNLTTVCASDARAGKSLAEVRDIVPGGIPACFSHFVFDPLDVDVLVTKGVKVAFSALPADVASSVEKAAAAKGIKIFSNAGSFRMDPDVPILIPEINHPHLELVQVQLKKHPGYIVCNANCTTTGLTLALAPLLPLNIERLIVASYQAVSGAGYPGVPYMDIAANVIPFISNEEPKVRREVAKIFGQVQDGTICPRDWHIFAHCVRVGSVVGHLISVHVEVRKATDYDRVAQLIKDYQVPDEVAGSPTAPLKPIYFMTDPLRPQPRYDVELGEPERTRGMAIAIGRLEVCGNVIRFVTLSNNLVRGAAGGSVLNAELAYRQGYLL
jgi:aspartate-semialdehyde dehydrogenase